MGKRIDIKPLLLSVMVLFGISMITTQARADFQNNAGESAECSKILREGTKTTFRSPGEEMNYTNRYTACWAENLIMRSKTPPRSFIGKSLELFANPAYIEALGFSKQLCKTAGAMIGYRADYPCWFEIQTAQQNVSLELAAKREVPKILFANTIPNRDGSISVEYVLCTNDDPTKAKEYSKGCTRGKNMTLTEYGRGDINGDNDDDILVTIKYGDNGDDRKKCFIAGFTRKDAQLMRMFAFSPNGLCE